MPIRKESVQAFAVAFEQWEKARQALSDFLVTASHGLVSDENELTNLVVWFVSASEKLNICYDQVAFEMAKLGAPGSTTASRPT